MAQAPHHTLEICQNSYSLKLSTGSPRNPTNEIVIRQSILDKPGYDELSILQ